MQSTAKAVWECFRQLGMDSLRGVGSSRAGLNIHPHLMEDDGNTLRSSYFAVISGVGDLQGTYTQKVARRYKGSQRSVFISRMISEPRFRVGHRGASAFSSMQVILEESADDRDEGALQRGTRDTSCQETVMAFTAWDELVPPFPIDVETVLLGNICNTSATTVSASV
ncbi:hypothetical protein PC116_g14580 [Phytophthora cactorum]|uniref:Uncharacterized protein n=2 Tax=Phytophthora cactorum TaxID=29920 RepID=A0A8T1KKP5_9STRA|nr:hypothetical protein PC112_g16094 [Phytophthora cactorum]KAG2918036.1 hypothetical protein PC117_g17217 [Phytophthora cactorum]KAG3146227.1 hypothetical protein C6341_g18120 [Phytophthora cactorum]KAG4237357.1 hypothetical protein PC116_g14580 [Phytophthora cactorum]